MHAWRRPAEAILPGPGRRALLLFLLASVWASVVHSRTGSPDPGTAASCGRVLSSSAAYREELTYTIRWGIISAGTAVLRLIPENSGSDARFRIETTAVSNSFIDTFYKVRDRAVSVVDSGFRRSLYFSKIQREGSFARDEYVEYDTLESASLYFRDGKLITCLRLPEEYQDPVSGLYRFRVTPAEPGKTVSMYALDGRRLMKVRGEILAREKVTVPAGTFTCLKVELFPETLEGPFMRKKHGRIFLWFSDDECRLPVKMSTEVVIGAVETVLEKIAYQPLTAQGAESTRVP